MSSPIYRNLTQESLDLQYDTHRLVPGVEAYRVRWVADSARARRELQGCVLDIPYGPSSLQQLDVFPAVQGAGPVHIFYHGGYWSRSDKLYYSFIAQALARHNVTTVIPNYPLCPGASMAELIEQCRAALAWTYRSAGAFGGDVSRLYLSGHSAGGHIVAMLMNTDWRRFRGVPANVIQGVTAISGLYDLEPVRLCSMSASIGLSQQDVAEFSPGSLPAPNPVIPAVIAVGGLESEAFRAQSADYAAHLKAAGGPVHYLEAPGHHHYSIFDAFCNERHPLGQAVLQQMGLA